MNISVTDIYTNASKTDLMNIKFAELRRSQNEYIEKANKYKTRYLSYKADYGSEDELTIRTKNNALKMWNKSEEYRVRIENLKK